MIERYMSISNGFKNGEKYTILAKIISGTKSDDNSTFEFLDNKNTQREADRIPLGTIIEYQTTRVVTKQTLNLNSKSKED